DDHAGVFSFEHDHFQIIESCGHLSIRVQRHSGARGKVVIPYRTSDGTAIGDKHFETKEGELVFDDNQTEWIPSELLQEHVIVRVSVVLRSMSRWRMAVCSRLQPHSAGVTLPRHRLALNLAEVDSQVPEY
ncbi:Calx-beta domain protein, partial [Ancylostoma duodenale]